MVVQHNMSAINANRYYGMNNSKLSKSLEKLSSGYAINRAGDNAAGLAVSEKMRAQISGLTQAAKNAQDGISMTQTFEGALTETDSILQRMRSLATQSANGSYDDSVDRAAIQLEYDQLNDELDQIADTDFNGVTVLNGGQMADGLQAIDGLFDYTNKKDQIIAEATDALATATADAKTAYDAAQTTFDGTNYDLSEDGKATGWNTFDNNAYDKTTADALWVELGLTDTAGTAADPSTVNEVTVTFTMLDDGSWETTSATGNDGSTQDASKFVASETDNGGFTVASAGGEDLGNAIFDSTTAKAGDTVTLIYTNAKAETYAPTNIGFGINSVDVDDTSTGTSALTDPSIALATGLDNDAMTEDIKKVLDALQGAEFKATYDATAGFAAGEVTLAGEDISQAVSGSATTITIGTGTDAITFDVKGDSTTAGSSKAFTISKDGTDLFTLTLAADAALTSGNDDLGTVTGTIAFEAYDYANSNNSITSKVGSNDELTSSTDNATALQTAKDKYDELMATSTSNYADAKAYLAKTGVSVSDSNDASTAKLSYTDNITLQVGARTKDSVNFTFKYQSDGMGELASDLNCTAKGLGTDQLSLASQADANSAIDKIDNAINKVSMVRGTFGALQNRLEHKIDNLNTTNENLTAAESRIRDTDMATEMMNFTKQQILSQASQAMLAQANTLPQGVLQLLQ